MSDGNTKYEKIEESAHDSGFTYEHFPVVCPTCEGTGEIYEDNNGMVTFVPVKDKRLKPARTKLKATVLVLIILAAAGVSTFFLYPRDVNISVSASEVAHFNFKCKYPWISYIFAVTINNKNFFSVQVTDLHMQLLYREMRVGNQSFQQHIHVSPREVKKTMVVLNVTYAAETSKYIRRECYKERYYVPQLMVSSAEMKSWMHSEHIVSKNDYFYMNCASMIFPGHKTHRILSTMLNNTKVNASAVASGSVIKFHLYNT